MAAIKVSRGVEYVGAAQRIRDWDAFEVRRMCMHDEATGQRQDNAAPEW